MTLKDLIESEGYMMEYYYAPQSHPDAIGFPTACPFISCQLLTGNRIAVKPECEDDAYYSASHEIAEHRHGFEHSAEMFCEQANILSRWLKKVANEALSISEYGSRSRDS